MRPGRRRKTQAGGRTSLGTPKTGLAIPRRRRPSHRFSGSSSRLHDDSGPGHHDPSWRPNCRSPLHCEQREAHRDHPCRAVGSPTARPSTPCPLHWARRFCRGVSQKSRLGCAGGARRVPAAWGGVIRAVPRSLLAHDSVPRSPANMEQPPQVDSVVRNVAVDLGDVPGPRSSAIEDASRGPPVRPTITTCPPSGVGPV